MDTRISRADTGSLLAVLATLLLPATSRAADEYLVPPENAAAVQYTEAYPTAGGNRSAEGSRPARPLSPSQTLGTRNARRLQTKGAEGTAAARLAAATAPTPIGDANARRPRHGTDRTPSAPDLGRVYGNGARSAGGPDAGDGSSGFSTAIGQMLGLSGGAINPIIVIAFLSAIGWLAAYATRRGKKPAS